MKIHLLKNSLETFSNILRLILRNFETQESIFCDLPLLKDEDYIVTRFFDNKSCLKLAFAVMFRASKKLIGININ